MEQSRSRKTTEEILAKSKVYGIDRYEFAINALRTSVKVGATVFDIGAGDAPMKNRVESAGFNWTGFDLLPKNPTIQEWNLDEPCPVGRAKCDAILLLEVIEHLTNAATGLKNIRESLRPDGILILTTPNPRWSRSRLVALGTGYLACFTIPDLKNNGHVFPVWPHVLVKLLDDAGFVVDEFGSLEGPTRHWPKLTLHPSWLVKFAGNLVCRMVEYQDQTACGMSYGMIARAI